MLAIGPEWTIRRTGKVGAGRVCAVNEVADGKEREELIGGIAPFPGKERHARLGAPSKPDFRTAKHHCFAGQCALLAAFNRSIDEVRLDGIADAA